MFILLLMLRLEKNGIKLHRVSGDADFLIVKASFLNTPEILAVDSNARLLVSLVTTSRAHCFGK